MQWTLFRLDNYCGACSGYHYYSGLESEICGLNVETYYGVGAHLLRSFLYSAYRFLSSLLQFGCERGDLSAEGALEARNDFASNTSSSGSQGTDDAENFCDSVAGDCWSGYNKKV